MKKGFTIVELLAVMIILAIIIVIAVPMVLKTIDNAKINIYKNSVASVAKAAKYYLAENINMYPKTIGGTLEVTVNDLIANGYIKAIQDPDNKGDTCNGYVIITKIDEKIYDYSPSIKCGNDNTITDKTTDKLLAHYTFDDYQEATTNLITLPNLNNVTSSDIPEEAKAGGATGYSTYSTGYGVHMRATTSTSAVNTFTFTVWMRSPSAVKSTYLIYVMTGVGGDGGWQNFGSSSLTNYWKKITGTRTYAAGTVTNTLIYRVNQLGTIDICAPQLELKDHATPYTTSTRTPIVKDYSGNGKSATLSVAITPRYDRKSRNGTGSYYFNSNSTYVLSDSVVSLSGSQTFMAWIKPTDLSSLKGILSLHNHASTSNIGLNQVDAKLAVSLGYTDGSREYDIKKSTASLAINTWSHAALVYNADTNKIRFYINGKFDSEHTVTKTVKFTDEKLAVGEWSVTYLNSAYDFLGNIDEAKLYGRVLPDDAIKYIYDVEK